MINAGYRENILRTLTGQKTFQDRESAFYIALGYLNGSGVFTEPSGTDYGYQRVTLGTAGMYVEVDGGNSSITNENQITFPYNQGSSSWPAVDKFAIYDSSSGGNQVILGSLSGTDPVVVGVNQVPIFPTHALVITLQGGSV